MGVGQVFDVNIVADTRAILGGVVVTKDEDLVPMPQRHLQYQGNEVGFHLTVFAHRTVGAGHIEIAQAGGTQPVGVRVGGDGIVDRKLAGPIGVGGGGGHVLSDRHPVGLPIGGRG